MDEGLNIPLKFLGSEELSEQVLNDIDSLLELAESKGMIAKMLVVGKFFIEFGSVQAVIEDLKIRSWNYEVSENLVEILEIVREKTLSIYENCERSAGRFASEGERGYSIYFDPDEYYMSLKCIDPTREAKDGDKSTKDGYLISSLEFPPHEVLLDFRCLSC